MVPFSGGYCHLIINSSQKVMRILKIFMLLFVVFGAQSTFGKTNSSKEQSTEAASQEDNGIWLRPSCTKDSKLMWGFKDGIRVAIAPIASPRGLISIHAPYLNFPERNILQFIAMEPIVKDSLKRGFSELEWSKLDNVRGKHIWSCNTSAGPSSLDRPACGVISDENGKETLTVYLFCEKFDNGAEVYVRIKFTEGRPYEFEITPYVTKQSKELERFILTATMCNKPRLRNLYLNGGVVLQSTDIWPEYKDINFADHFHVSPENMVKDSKGGVWFIAAPNEDDTTKATYDEGTAEHWKYNGKKATQYWYCPRPSEELRGVVNGRYTYWQSANPLPGGIAFENFELTEPFELGQTYVFGITPQSAEEFIAEIEK